MGRFPIQGGLTISWAAAQRAYENYARKYGTSQSLERLAERGGFGLYEFCQLWWNMTAVGEDRIVQALREACVST